MANNLIEVKVTNELGDELLLTNVFASGAIVHDDMVVVSVYGKEANVSIAALRSALNAVEGANTQW